jgi:hypothetical protein
MTSEESVQTDEQGPKPQIPRLGATASGFVGLLLVGALFVIPFFGLLIAPLGCLPVLHFQSEGTPGFRAWGPPAALLAVAAMAGFAGIGLPLLAAYSLLVVVPSVTVDLWTRTKWNEGRWIAVATIVGLIGTLSAVATVAAPQTPMDAVATWMRTSSEEIGELYSAWGLTEGSAELVLDAAERAASWVLPSVPVAYLVVILFWVRPRLPVLGLPVEVGAFEAFRNDEWLAALFVIGGAGTLLLSGTARWAAINLLVVVLILYFVQGLAMIRAHLARWIGRGWLVRWGVVLLCVQGPLPLLVAALGVADSFHPLRPQPDNNGG